MSDIFAMTDTNADAKIAAAKANSVDSLADFQAPWYRGTVSGFGQGVVRGVANLNDLLLTGTDLIVPMSDTEHEQQEFLRQHAIDTWTPRANEVGRVGQVLGGLGEIAAPLAVGGLPTLAGSVTLARGKALVDQGVDAGTAGGVAAVEGAANVVGFEGALLGNTLLTRLASGAATNVVVGSASRKAEKTILDARGYPEQAQSFNQDLSTVSMDALTGLLFGGVGHLTRLNPELTSTQTDAVLTARNAKSFASATAPGEPVDVRSGAAHQATLETAMSQLAAGGKVDVGDMVAKYEGAEFKPGEQIAANNEAARNVDAAVRESLPAEEPVDQDIARLPPEQRGVFQRTFAAAHTAKPVFDEQLGELAKATGSTAQLADLKSTTRAVDKVLTDYKGDASRLKDVVRGTIVAPDSASAIRAIDEIHARFHVIPEGQRNLFADDANPVDGYRDAKFNVRMPDGTTAEIQVHLPEMLAAKKLAHELYVQRQKIERLAADRDLTAAERAKVDALNAQMKDVYRPAWAAALGNSALNRSGETLAPLRNMESSGNLRSVPSSDIARTASPPPGEVTTTGTPSTSQNPTISDIVATPPREILAQPVTKEFLKKTIDIRPVPDVKTLSKNAGDYVQRTTESTDIPISRLVAGKSESVAENALKRFAAAAAGEIPKREPVSVEVLPDGKFRVIDGNGTVAAMRAIGTKTVPAVVHQEAANVSKLSLADALAAKPEAAGEVPAELSGLRQLAAERPNLTIYLGRDADGNPIKTTVADEYDRITREYEQDIRDTGAYEAAVNCFLAVGA